jgi:hypothetical protein
VEVSYVLDALRMQQLTSVMPLSGLPTGNVTPGFIKQNSQSAIQYIFTVFEDHLRKRLGLGPEVYGQDLINRAFGDHGSLTYGATSAERIGVRNLVSGAYATFRNPSMHRIINNDEQLVLSVIVLVDLLARLVNEAHNKPGASP